MLSDSEEIGRFAKLEELSECEVEGKGREVGSD